MARPASNDNGLLRPPRDAGGAASGARSLEEMLDASDLEVPAAVVCARCGLADCMGCAGEQTRSGVISIVAWERRDLSLLRRLWQTSCAATQTPEAFFEALPDGPIGPALRFAMTSELIAASAMLVALVPVAVVVAPLWMKELAFDATARMAALRCFVVGVPALATMLVVAHAVHGLALDIGATRSGARPARSRALRFGLYATGWDLVLGPLGAVVLLFDEGLASAASLARLGVGLPSRSARAFLRGAYGLYAKGADRAVRASYIAAIAATLIAALSIFAAIIALVLS